MIFFLQESFSLHKWQEWEINKVSTKNQLLTSSGLAFIMLITEVYFAINAITTLVSYFTMDAL